MTLKIGLTLRKFRNASTLLIYRRNREECVLCVPALVSSVARWPRGIRWSLADDRLSCGDPHPHHGRLSRRHAHRDEDHHPDRHHGLLHLVQQILRDSPASRGGSRFRQAHARHSLRRAVVSALRTPSLFSFIRI